METIQHTILLNCRWKIGYFQRKKLIYTVYKKAIQGSMVWKYECVQILRQHILKPQIYNGMTDG
jgi:hypothetical protein